MTSWDDPGGTAPPRVTQGLATVRLTRDSVLHIQTIRPEPGAPHPLYLPTIPPHQPGLGTTQLGTALRLERTEMLHPGQLSLLSLPRRLLAPSRGNHIGGSRHRSPLPLTLALTPQPAPVAPPAMLPPAPWGQ